MSFPVIKIRPLISVQWWRHTDDDRNVDGPAVNGPNVNGPADDDPNVDGPNVDGLPIDNFSKMCYSTSFDVKSFYSWTVNIRWYFI